MQWTLLQGVTCFSLISAVCITVTRCQLHTPASYTWFNPDYFRSSCACPLSASFSSADRLLSHSHHAIPFPVCHPEFWPFPFSPPSGRQRATKHQSWLEPSLRSARGLSRTFLRCSSSLGGSISISSLARAGHGQAVTLEAKDRMTLSLFRACMPSQLKKLFLFGPPAFWCQSFFLV